MPLSSTSRVQIVGVGAQTSVGRTMLSSAAAVRAGINLSEEHPYVLDRHGEPVVVARAQYLPDDLTIVDRMTALALFAVQDALAPLEAGGGENPSPVPLFLGLPSTRRGVPEMLEHEIRARVTRQIASFPGVGEVETFEAGHAAGLMALEQAFKCIRDGRSRICLAGSVDSYMDPLILEGLERSGQLHSGSNRWGFCPGEGAGFCLLASAEAAREMVSLGEIVSVATAREEALLGTESVCVAQGLSSAWGEALGGLSVDRLSQVVCDLNGEPYRSEELGYCLARFSDLFVDGPTFQAPALCWGDVGAASGSLGVGLAVSAAARGWALGSTYLVSASSMDGERAAVLVSFEGSEERGV